MTEKQFINLKRGEKVYRVEDYLQERSYIVVAKENTSILVALDENVDSIARRVDFKDLSLTQQEAREAKIETLKRRIKITEQQIKLGKAYIEHCKEQLRQLED